MCKYDEKELVLIIIVGINYVIFSYSKTGERMNTTGVISVNDTFRIALKTS